MTEKVKAFETGLGVACFTHNVKLGRWPQGMQVFELALSKTTLIYVKDSALKEGWWGIAFTVYKRVLDSKLDWHLVLFVGDGEEGYLLPGNTVNAMVNGLSTNATEYIFHESDLDKATKFKTFDDLYALLLK